MRVDRIGAFVFLAAVALSILLAGCGRRAGPPPIARGAPCAGCGMTVTDLRFACEREAQAGRKVYDSIECLMGGLADGAPGAAALADYDSGILHRADSLWVVKGDFPTPMGGGYAAFLARAAADSVAAATGGRVGRLADFVAARGGG